MIVIPDIHQDINFVEKILNKHYTEGDTVLFLGDYYDTLNKNLPGVKKVSEFLNELYKNKDFIFLMGNHDIPYYEAYALARSKNADFAHKPFKYWCTGYTNNKAKRIYKSLDYDFFRSMKLFYQKHGYTFSHAGFSPYVFSPGKSIEENLDVWGEECINLHRTINTPVVSRIYQVGPSRGGRFVRAGGPVWLDFTDEFEPIDGFPQIFGHTGRKKTIFQCEKEMNFCIDNNQTTYMMIDDKQINILIDGKIVMEKENIFGEK